MIQRIYGMVLLSSVLTALAAAAAPNPTLPPIKEIEDAKPKQNAFDAAAKENPVVIRSAKEAEMFFAGEDLVKLTTRVDFDRQFVLLFAWRGSGRDRLTYDVLESYPEQVRFRLIPGLTKDLRPHVQLYALRLNVRWKSGRVSPAAADTKGSDFSYVIVTEGIVGGIVPAHVRQQIIVVNRKGKYEVLLLQQPSRGDEPIFRRGALKADKFNSLLNSIKNKGLFELPVESPPGSQDIYELDTSVAVRMGKSFWRNGGPAGCVHGQSTIQPTGKQRQEFRAIVEFVKDFAREQAKDTDNGTGFTEIVEQIRRNGSRQ